MFFYQLINTTATWGFIEDLKMSVIKVKGFDLLDSSVVSFKQHIYVPVRPSGRSTFHIDEFKFKKKKAAIICMLPFHKVSTGTYSIYPVYIVGL